MPLDLDWDRPLRYRKGGEARLLGIDVYYDIDWRATFGHDTSQFQNGYCLAKRVIEMCPQGRTPALLLTNRAEAQVGLMETPLHLVFVLNNVREYSRSRPDASMSFLAGVVGASHIMRAGQLSEFAGANPDDIRAFLELNLNPDYITEWISGRTDRLDALHSIPAVGDRAKESITPREAIDALAALGDTFDPELVAALAEVLGPNIGREQRITLLRSLTADADGRSAAGEIVVARTPDRVQDARRTVDDYQALLDSGAGETPLQGFIEQHPWLLGLDYVRVRHRRDIPRATVDFLVERYDGFHDLLELKNPQDSVIVAPEPVDGAPPSPSGYKLSPDLAQALAQVHLYRDILTNDAPTVLQRYGLEHTRDPRVIIVIGRDLPPHRAEVLRELNKSLHRVEIVPYDALADRAIAALANVERYLAAAGGADDT